MNDDLIARISTTAARQHALIRTDQVSGSELDRLRRLAQRGVLQRAGKGVYRIAGAPQTWRQSLQVGIWTLGPTAMVSHSAAAQLHGFEGFDAGVVEFTVERAQRDRASLGSGRVHSTSHRSARDRTTVDGLPVTTALRTILDLARDGAPDALLESAIDSAIRLRLTTLGHLLDRVTAIRGGARWGIAKLDALLSTSGGHTLLERQFLALMHAAGLPRPMPQVVHRSGGVHLARVDFEFIGHDLVVEVSGGRGHSSAAERAKDARRRNALQQRGRTVLEFTYEQVTYAPTSVVATVRRSLAMSGFQADSA